MKKNSLYLFVILIIGALPLNAAKPILIYNNSTLDIYAESHRSGCSGVSYNPWSGDRRSVSCGDTKPKVIPGRPYASVQNKVSGIGINDDAPAWASLGYSYPVYVRTQDGRIWQSKNEVKPGAALFFPQDFQMTQTDMWNLLPGYPVTDPDAYISKGSFVSLVNQSSDTITTPAGQIAQNGTLNFTYAQPRGLVFTGKTITFTGQTATIPNSSYTFTFDPAYHTLTLEGNLIAEQVTTYQAQLFMSPLFEKYEVNGSQITTFQIALAITKDYAPHISQITINLISKQKRSTVTLTEQELISNQILNVIQKTP